MATSTKISALTALGAAPASNDLLVLVDVSDTSQSPNGTTKKMTTANLFTSPSIASPTLTGTVAGTPTWASNQAITLSTAAQPNVTSVGTLMSLTVSGTSSLQAVTLSGTLSLTDGQFIKSGSVNIGGISGSTNVLFAQTVGGFAINNQANSANLVTVSNAGTVAIPIGMLALNSSNANGIVPITINGGNLGQQIRWVNPASSGRFNWMTGTNLNAGGSTFEWTPSTAADGGTFTTPVMTLTRTGDLTVSGASSLQSVAATSVSVAGTVSVVEAITSTATSTIVSYNNTNASSQGAGLQVKQGGTSRGYVGVSGAWLGSTASNMAIAAYAGGGIELYTNGGSTPAVTVSTAGLATLSGGATVASGQTLTLTGATVAGAPTWSSSQAITLSTAAQPNITSVGTLTSLTLGTPLTTANGGTGLASYTAGDLSYYASGTALSKLAIGAANRVLTSSGSAPQWSTSLAGLSSVSATTISASSTFDLNAAFQIKTKYSTVSTSDVIINNGASTDGSLALVRGDDGGGKTFYEAVFYSSATANVVSTITSGAPSARTYSASGGALQLHVASGTYNVGCSDMRGIGFA